MLDAHIWVHKDTGDARFVVTSDLRLYWSCPALHPRHWGLTSEEEYVLVAKFVRKAVDKVAAKAQAKSAAALMWESTHPAIWEYLTLAENDDGSERVTSMLCVFVEGGVVKVALQDRQEGQSLWVASQSLMEALDALEGRLQGGDADWRQARKDYKPSARKR